MSFHLLVCISSHGFGHFAMTAPILTELNKLDSMSLTVRCELPETLIRSRIKGDFNIISESSDFGMVMNGSLDVDLEKTALAYQALHENFSQAIEFERQKLLSYKPDLILANVPYLTIAAAKKANIPVIAYCSLNWAEIFKSYFENKLPEAEKILNDMNTAYNAAEYFICPAPSMAMPSLKNVKLTGPVANPATNIREKLSQLLDVTDENKLVLITPGGVVTPVPVNDWPEIPGVVWITAWPYESTRKDIISTDEIDVPFSDLLASCDALITKPGYGTVTEAACNGVPSLYVLRGDWAEEPFLERWWCDNSVVLKISREDFFTGNVTQSLEKLWGKSSLNASESVSAPIRATGTNEIVSIIRQRITQ